MAALNEGQASLIELHPHQGQTGDFSPRSHQQPSPWTLAGAGTGGPPCQDTRLAPTLVRGGQGHDPPVGVWGVRVLPVGCLAQGRRRWQVAATTGTRACMHTRVPSQPHAHACHMCMARTYTRTPIAMHMLPAHVCTCTHACTHACTGIRISHPPRWGDAPPPPQHPAHPSHPMWGAVLCAHSTTHCRVAWGKRVLGRLGVTLSEHCCRLPRTPQLLTGTPQSNTHTPWELGGCREAQAPAQHHFLLSLWCRAKPGLGETGDPQAPRVAQVGAAGAARGGAARGRMWGQLDITGGIYQAGWWWGAGWQ